MKCKVCRSKRIHYITTEFGECRRVCLKCGDYQMVILKEA